MPTDQEFWSGVASLQAQMGGLEGEPEEPGFFEKYVRRPVAAGFGLSQNLLVEPLLGETEAYKRAAAELQQSTGRESGAWEALPGLGDVGAQLLPESWPEAAKLLPRLAGNIAGDPLTYLPVGLLGRAGKLAERGVKAAATAGKITPELEAGLNAWKLGSAGRDFVGPVRAADKMARMQATRDVLKLVDPKLARTHDLLTFAGMGTDAGMAAVAGVAFAPTVAEGFLQAGKLAVEKAKEGELGEAAGAGATSALMAGLLALMGKGAISTLEASRVLKGSLERQAPAVAPLLEQRAAEAAFPIGPERQLPRGPIIMGPGEVPPPGGFNFIEDTGQKTLFRDGWLEQPPPLEPAPVEMPTGGEQLGLQFPEPPPPLVPLRDNDLLGAGDIFGGPRPPGPVAPAAVLPRMVVPRRQVEGGLPEPPPLEVAPQVAVTEVAPEVRQPSRGRKLSRIHTPPQEPVPPVVAEVAPPVQSATPTEGDNLGDLPGALNPEANAVGPDVSRLKAHEDARPFLTEATFPEDPNHPFYKARANWLAEGQAITKGMSEAELLKALGAENKNRLAAGEPLQERHGNHAPDLAAQELLRRGKGNGEKKQPPTAVAPEVDNLGVPPSALNPEDNAVGERPATPKLDELERVRAEAEAKLGPKEYKDWVKANIPRGDDPVVADEVGPLAAWYRQRIQRGAVGDPGDERAITGEHFVARRMVKPAVGDLIRKEAAAAERQAALAPPAAAAEAPAVASEAIQAALETTGKKRAPREKSARVQELLTKEQEVSARLAQRRKGKLGAGLDPEDFADLVLLGSYKIERGLREFGPWAAEMIEQLGEEIREHLPTIWKAVQKETTPVGEAERASLRYPGVLPEAGSAEAAGPPQLQRSAKSGRVVITSGEPALTAEEQQVLAEFEAAHAPNPDRPIAQQRLAGHPRAKGGEPGGGGLRGDIPDVEPADLAHNVALAVARDATWRGMAPDAGAMREGVLKRLGVDTDAMQPYKRDDKIVKKPQQIREALLEKGFGNEQGAVDYERVAQAARDLGVEEKFVTTPEDRRNMLERFLTNELVASRRAKGKYQGVGDLADEEDLVITAEERLAQRAQGAEMQVPAGSHDNVVEAQGPNLERDLQEKAAYAQGRMEKLTGQRGAGASRAWFRRLSDAEVRGHELTGDNAGPLRLSRGRTETLVDFYHQVAKEHGNPSAEVLQLIAEKTPHMSGELPLKPDKVARIKRIYDSLLAHPELQLRVESPGFVPRVEKLVVKEPVPPATLLPLERRLKIPPQHEAPLPVQGTQAERVPAVRARAGMNETPGVTFAFVPRTSGKQRGPGGTVDPVRFVMRGAGGKGELAGKGVSIEFSRTDTPGSLVTSAKAPSGAEVSAAKLAEFADTVEVSEATSIRLDNSKGHDPEGVATVLRSLVEANPKLAEISISLEANPTLKQALRQLEKEGVLVRQEARAAVVAPGVEPVRMPSGAQGGVPRAAVETGPGSGLFAPAPKKALAQVEFTKAEVKAFRDQLSKKGQVADAQAAVDKAASRLEAANVRSGWGGVENAPAQREARVELAQAKAALAEAKKGGIAQLTDEQVRLKMQVRAEDTARVERSRAEVELARQEKLGRAQAAEWQRLGRRLGPPEPVGEAALGPVRKPTAVVYGVPGRRVKSKPERVVANSMAEHADDHLPADVRALREAADADQIDRAVEKNGVRVANVGELHDAATLERLAGAHAKLMPELKAVGDEIAGVLGVDGKVEGVMSNPDRHALVIGDVEGGRGGIWLNAQNALSRAEAEGRGLRGAAETMVDEQIVHELAHLQEQSVLHGDTFEQTMAKMVEKVRAAGEQREGWIERLSRPEQWEPLQKEAAAYRKLEAASAGSRRSRVGAEGGVGGVRAGAAEGRAAAASNRAVEGADGAAARGGAGVQPGEPVLAGAGGETGAVGGAPAGGRGGELLGGGGGAGRVAGGREAGQREGARRVAYSSGGPRSLGDLQREMADLAQPTTPMETKRGRTFGLAFEAATALEKAAVAGDAAAKKEWEQRIKSGPTGKGPAWSRINSLYIVLPDHARASLSYWSEMTARDPELSRLYLADTPVKFADIDEQTQALLRVYSPEDIERRIKKGKRLTELDVNLARAVGTDLVSQWHEAETRYLDGVADGGLSAERLQKLDDERHMAENRMNLLDMEINETGTVPARQMAIRKWKLAAQDPRQQFEMKLQEGMRQHLTSKYRDVNELNQVLGGLMKLYRDGHYDEFQNAWHAAQKYDAFDALMEVFKGGLLGWTSRVANMGSNGLFAGYRTFEKNFASALDQMTTKKGAVPERFAEEALLGTRVARRALSGGLPVWLAANRDAFGLKTLEMTGRQFSEDLMQDFIHTPGAITGKKGEFFRFMFKTMNADDALAKHWSKTDSYYREALRSIKQGVKGWDQRPGEHLMDAVERHVDEMEKSISSALDAGVPIDTRYREIHKRAVELAAKETFQEPLSPGWAMGQRVLHSPGTRWLQTIVPFYKTPLNIAKQALKRTPLDLIDLVPNWKTMSRAEQIDAAARHGTAAMLVGGLWSLMEGSGLEVSGNGPIDPESNQLMKESGWQPYSIKVGDRWISYQRLEPIASLIGMIADAHEGMKQGDYDKFGTAVQRAVGTVAQNITSKTFLTGFQNTSNLFSDPQRYGGQWAKQVLGSFVPNSLGYLPFGHLARQLDPTFRDTGMDPVKIIQAKIPWLSKQLPPQYAPTGEERVRPDTLGPRVLSPIQVSTEKKTPEGRAARMLADIGFPMRRVRSTFPYKGVQVEITPVEQRELALAQQKALAFIGARLMKDPTFQALPNTDDDAAYPGQKTKKDVLARIVRKFREPVVGRMRPELRKRAAEQLGRNRTERRGGELGLGA